MRTGCRKKTKNEGQKSAIVRESDNRAGESRGMRLKKERHSVLVYTQKILEDSIPAHTHTQVNIQAQYCPGPCYN